MERLKRVGIVTCLIERMHEQGSWCGQTHVQKSVLFLQDVMNVPLEFEFVLYKHGPFSFELREEITSLRADEIVRLEPKWPYGPRISTTNRSKYIQSINTRTLAMYDQRIEFVARKLGDKGVTELEALATALHVTRKTSDLSVCERAKQLSEIKPHISEAEASGAVMQVDQFIAEAQELAG